MSESRISGDWKLGLAAAVERFSPAQVVKQAEEQERTRLIGLLLVAPLAVSAFTAPLFASMELPVLLALICGMIASAWSIVAIIASGGQLATARFLALASATVILAGVIRSAGFLSPAALILVALPIEAWWVTRRRSSLDMGLLCALAALVVAAGLQRFAPMPVRAVEAWHWIIPLFYLSIIVTRLDHFRGVTMPDEDAASDLEALADCGVLRLERQGEVTGVNAEAEMLLGLPETHLGGTAFFDRIHVQDRVIFLSAIDATCQDGMPRDMELRIGIPSGEVSTAIRRFGLRVAMRGDGRIFGLLRDRQPLFELGRAAERAEERADNLDIAKGRFLAAVSHELRTPLNAIIGFSDMMLEGMAGPFADPRQTEYVGIVRESGQHLLSVVNAILDVSKIESGTYAINPEPFRFAEAVELCRSMMAVQAETKQITLRVQIEPGVGEVCGDRRAIQQTLINLVCNAIKFTPEGGSVTIGAHRQGRQLQFWITDTGIGIADCDLDRLGRPFMQLNNDYTRHFEGAGLGLSIVKGLIALHRGGVSIASRQGQGTTVTVTLPLDGPNSVNEDARDRLVTHAEADTAQTFRKSA